MANINWPEVFEKGSEAPEFKNLDKYAIEHINNFWNVYGLTLTNDIDHKMEHLGWRLAYWAKAHYEILTVYINEKGEPVYVTKIRGASKNYALGIAYLYNFKKYK